MADILRKIEAIAREQNATHVTKVSLRLGALAHISPEHLREHFVEAVRGTVAEGAELSVESIEEIHDPHAQDILLTSVEIAE